MSFGHWLKGATRIRFDDRTLGNLIKNGAVAGGTALGGVGGLALAGLGSAAGQKALGGSWSDAASAGLKGAATAGGLHAGMGVAKGLLNSGANAATSATGGLPIPADANITGAQIPTGATFGYTGPAGSGGLASKALDLGKGVGSFIEHNPTAAAMGLQAAGNLATSGAQNRTANAQADLLQKQAEETEYDFNRRKMRDAQLAPVWSALGTTIGGSYGGVARNPYLPAGG